MPFSVKCEKKQRYSIRILENRYKREVQHCGKIRRYLQE